MRYKAMAKKLRQLVELDDPIPAEAVLANEEELQNIGASKNRSESTNNYTSENTDECTTECTNKNTDKRTTECTNENTDESTNEHTIECTDKRTTECTNENTNKPTSDCIVEYTDTSSNSLQNSDSNSTDNKNAITMRNKFALVENYRGENRELSNSRAIDGVEGGDLPRECADESGELSNGMAIDGGEWRELPRDGANEGGDLPRECANEGGELANDMARSGDENENLHHICDEVANGREIKYDALLSNRLTIEDRKQRIYQLLHAIAIYKEVVDGVNGVTQLMARVDAFLDPERIEEATTLAMWRERYKNEIIVRNKFKWWKK